MSASPDLLARAAAASAFLRGTAKMVGKPGAVQGTHVAGPTRGRSVVVLDMDVAAVLDELIAAAVLDVSGAPPPPSPVPVTAAAPTTRRFRGLIDE